MITETSLTLIFRKSIYNDHNRFMVSWWKRYSYFNNEQIQTGDVALMNYEYGFGSLVRAKYIGHNTNTGRISNSC